MVRGPTAYFLFADTVRASVQAELQARQPDGKLSVAILGKAIGERWQALSDEEKQVYKDQAGARAVGEDEGSLFGVPGFLWSALHPLVASPEVL